MDQIENCTDSALGFSPNTDIPTPNITPGYHKCLTCPDYGTNCNGPSLGSLGDIASVRTFHKAMRKVRKLPLKAVAGAAPSISEYTINEYFSNVVKDYKWTTVIAIDNAMTAICGNRIGLPPLDHSCPASSSEVRQQLAAADMKLAAAELRAAKSESDVIELQKKITDIKGNHIAQLEQMQATHKNDTDWLKEDIRFWRKISFIAMGIGLILLGLVLIYFLWDMSHADFGFFRW